MVTPFEKSRFFLRAFYERKSNVAEDGVADSSRRRGKLKFTGVPVSSTPVCGKRSIPGTTAYPLTKIERGFPLKIIFIALLSTFRFFSSTTTTIIGYSLCIASPRKACTEIFHLLFALLHLDNRLIAAAY